MKDYVNKKSLQLIKSKKQIIHEIFEGFAWLHSKKIGENFEFQ